MTSLGCYSVKILSTTVGYSLVSMVTDLCRRLTGACHTVYAMSEILAEIHSLEKCDFVKSMIHSQIIQFSVISQKLCFSLL